MFGFLFQFKMILCQDKEVAEEEKKIFLIVAPRLSQFLSVAQFEIGISIGLCRLLKNNRICLLMYLREEPLLFSIETIF